MNDRTPASREEEAIEINLRSVDEVVYRAVALITLARRGAIDDSYDRLQGDVDTDGAESDRFELYSWARRELSGALTSVESSILRARLDSLDSDDVEHCTDALISTEALCWSLGILEGLPDPVVPSDSAIRTMLTWAPEPWQEPGRLVSKFRLRDELAIARERERRELWHWRASLDLDDFESTAAMAAAVRETAREANATELIEVLNDDFSWYGHPMATLSSHEISELAAIAQLQVKSLNWLCGFGDSWDSAPLYVD